MHVTKASIINTAERFLQDGGCTGLSCKCCPFGDRKALRALGYCGTSPCVGISQTLISEDGRKLLSDILAWARSDVVVTPSPSSSPSSSSSSAQAPTRFEVGHWYRYDGPKERAPFWSNDGMMDFVLDGKPHQCIKSTDRYAGEGNFLIWFWGDSQQHFVEVPAPSSDTSTTPTIVERMSRADVEVIAALKPDDSCPHPGEKCTTCVVALLCPDIDGRRADAARAWLAHNASMPVVATSRRLTVGDRVVIVGTDMSGGGKHGVIVKDDHKEIPYCVRLDDGTAYWKHDSHVRPERDDERPSCSDERPMSADDALRYVVQATPTRPFDPSRVGVSTPASRARALLNHLGGA